MDQFPCSSFTSWEDVGKPRQWLRALYCVQGLCDPFRRHSEDKDKSKANLVI